MVVTGDLAFWQCRKLLDAQDAQVPSLAARYFTDISRRLINRDCQEDIRWSDNVDLQKRVWDEIGKFVGRNGAVIHRATCINLNAWASEAAAYPDLFMEGLKLAIEPVVDNWIKREAPVMVGLFPGPFLVSLVATHILKLGIDTFCVCDG